MPKIQYCCSRFKAQLDEAGKRGLSIVVNYYSETGAFFELQTRACDFVDANRLLDIHRALPDRLKAIALPINLVSQIGIQFCPWCGARLSEILAQDPAASIEVASSMAYLVQKVD